MVYLVLYDLGGEALEDSGAGAEGLILIGDRDPLPALRFARAGKRHTGL